MLFSYPNVWNTCLLILRERGYRLFLLGDPDENDSIAQCTWNAEKDGMKFRAHNPIELLGLIAIREHRCPQSDTPYWWRIDGPFLIPELEAAWRKLISSEPDSTHSGEELP
jgi:hypothetical protein